MLDADKKSQSVEPADGAARLAPGTQILYGGNRLITVPEEIARQFAPGDRLLVAEGELLHVPRAEWVLAAAAVEEAAAAFDRMGSVTDAQITHFFDRFAAALADSETWARIARANAADVERARSRGRSTTRLVATEKMRAGMIDGLREWQQMPSQRGRVLETVEHNGWRVEQVVSSYGVVGFVFEGRPNVLADGTGVLRGGNATVMRIGSDALGTAKTILERALRPALAETGLPEGAVALIESASHAAGWAMFSQPKLGLAVARGSGRAAAQLGSIARQSGIPVSLHGTGGAWLVADESADPHRLRACIFHSLDRKVCNTLNVLCLPASRAPELVPLALGALADQGDRLGHGWRLHVVEGSETHVPGDLFTRRVRVLRAEGEREEPVADRVPEQTLAREWEWEGTPEITLALVSSIDHAVELFNRYSPRLVASLVSEDAAAQERFFASVDAPFVGDGFTRWVDGQYALRRPELGLSNREGGRLLTRSGILTGDGVYTVRMRMTQADEELHR
jgi:glutamate-5-semialdehyde dehydrogenase